ncbi:MAG: hypothetical protein KJ063_00800 [Anaerolineae bacterium]|nr:hypothetical protein [Anaerolineae bacterium]
MDFIRKQPILGMVLGFLVGLIIGLPILGWGLWPVQWTNAGPQDLTASTRRAYILAVADSYSSRRDDARVQEAFALWPEAPQEICRLALTEQDPADQQRLTFLAAVLSGNPTFCAQFAGQVPTTEGEGRGSTLFIICLLLIILLLVLFLLFRIATRRGGSTRPSYEMHVDKPTEGPMVDEGMDTGATMVPIARFTTTYNRGHDTYDDSFSVENSNGDFLGECGVGISESLGGDSPKNVTAMEVWLFDKNDIRTITKVMMTQHAYYDEAITAKLATKGEPALLRPGEVVALETNSLIINARILDMEYGDNPDMPPDSYLERITIELSAWAKEDAEGGGMADDMLNY